MWFGKKPRKEASSVGTENDILFLKFRKIIWSSIPIHPNNIVGNITCKSMNEGSVILSIQKSDP